jgi:predicted dehydrogenase
MEPKFGIIGCGNISKFHFAGLARANAKIVHVADIDLKKAQERAKPFQARFTADFRDVIRDPEVTVVSILGPGKFHKEMCLAALAAGKDVVCEKTLANSADEAYDIVQAARKTDRLFFTAFMKRFIPAAQKAKELLPSLGILFSAYARSYQCWGDFFSLKDASGFLWILENYGGAVIKCAGSHILDMILDFFGRPQSLYANIDYVNNSKLDRKAIALLEYPSSLVVTFEAAVHPLAKIGYERNSWDERLEITGTHGRLDLYTTFWEKPENNAPLLVHYDNAAKTSTEYRFDAVNPFDLEMEYICRCLKERTPGHPDVVDGFYVDTLISTMEESHQAKKPIEINWRSL